MNNFVNNLGRGNYVVVDVAICSWLLEMDETQGEHKGKRAADVLAVDKKKRSRAEILAATRDEEDVRLESLLFSSSTTQPVSGVPSKAGRASAGELDRHNRAISLPAPAWHDEDDGELAVDVAGVSRLRKLRDAEHEAVLDGATFAARLRRRHAGGELSEAPSWAAVRAVRGSEPDNDDSPDAAASSTDDTDDDDDDADAVLRRAGGILAAPSNDVDATTEGAGGSRRVAMTRVRDANRAAPCASVCTAVAWHPDGRVLVTAGLDKKLRFFAVDGRRNPRLASVAFPDMPITSASWSGDGREVICAGRRPFLYSYDVEAGAAVRVPRLLGADDRSLERCIVSPATALQDSFLAITSRDGAVLVLSARTKALIGRVKMGMGTARAAAFSRDPLLSGGPGSGDWPHLLTGGSAGDVYRWDMRMLGRCVVRHADEGSTGITALAAAPSGAEYAVGSRSGAVNTYDAVAAVQQARVASAMRPAEALSVSAVFAPASATPRPRSVLMPLVTGIDHLTYNSDGTLLAMASESLKDALRLVHTPSSRVIANWPTAKTPLHFVSATAFSPNSGYICIGNDRGRALLYRLTAYARA